MLIDTHAHLSFQDYKNIDSVIKRSFSSGVEKIICVSSNISDSIEAIDIAKKYPKIVYAAVGIHPQCTDPENKESIDVQLEKLEKLILENRNIVVAIGECGLDFTDVLSNERKRDLSEQEKIFRYQIDLAKKYDLPILLHFNKSHDYFLGNYQDLKNWRGIFHCYVGGKKRLKSFLEFGGFLFGVTGLVTYEEGLQQVVRNIPLDRMVLETDSPFLAPLPHRGERNEPAYIQLISESLSHLKYLDEKTIARQTTENVMKIFSI